MGGVGKKHHERVNKNEISGAVDRVKSFIC